jgi:4-alpha-glucanotransferase
MTRRDPRWGPRRAGISVPLFSLRSTNSWGIGEIGDVRAMASWLRSANQSVLQMLPMNELAPDETSPYSPLSAFAIDPQFISIQFLEDGPDLEKMMTDEIAGVRRSPRIDYKRVRGLKGRALKASFDRFHETEWLSATAKAEGLRSYIAREAWWIEEYGLYRALRAQAGEKPWTQWRPALRDCDPGALATAREELSREILFYQYVQWIVEDQWQEVRSASHRADVEIVGDFPFMVTLDSADVWSRRREFILDASVGTPPDAFSETGQEWGLPPYNWDVGRENGFAWLRMRARRFADLYDGFRVDHLVGFYRTYVRPLDGRAPYFLPAEEHAQIALGETVMGIMIETGSDVSVEDLGTVPDFVRESVDRLGLPGYKVLRWEPADPVMYPPVSIAVTGTHDTEPIAVWWETLSPAERRRFGLESPAFDSSIRDGILQRILNAGSNLVLIPIQDVFGWRDRINQPATIGDPNWTYVLPWPVDHLSNQREARERVEWLAEWSCRTGRWVSAMELDT